MTGPNLSTDDPYLPLAFSLHSNPGAYAVLAGAGVSMGANLPTAWDIVVDLARQICRPLDPTLAAALTAANVEKWYTDTFAEPLSYSGILSHVAPTPYEREAVLRRYFEPTVASTSGTSTPQRRPPSPAHKAIAELMVAGTIRVVVTMNFDHLFEDALRERGIDPVIISTDNAAAGMPPLHTIDHCVVHLHGDYRDAASMLNTGTELSSYELNMQRLLTQIVADYGLLIAGWSAVHDHALRNIVQRAHRRYYTAGWIDPGSLSSQGQQLVDTLNARVLPTTADEAFTHLTDIVSAMRRREARHPLTAATAADRIKRDLAGHHPAITAHDTLATELTRLDTLPPLAITNYNDQQLLDDYKDIVERIDESCTVPAAATAALAYWGTNDTDTWWTPAIEQWAHSIDTSGYTELLDLPLLVGVRLFYAAGIAASAARRYDTLAELVALPAITTRTNRRRVPACQVLDWHRVHSPRATDLLLPSRAALSAQLADTLSLSPTRLDTAWQEFETLRTAAQILTNPKFDTATLDTMGHLEHSWNAVRSAEPSDSKRDAWIAIDRHRATVARMASSVRPHIYVTDTFDSNGDQWISSVAQRLSDNPTPLASFRSLAAQLPQERRTEAVTVALAGAQKYFHLCGVGLADSFVSTSGMATVMPQFLWLDESGTAGVRV